MSQGSPPSPHQAGFFHFSLPRGGLHPLAGYLAGLAIRGYSLPPTRDVYKKGIAP